MYSKSMQVWIDNVNSGIYKDQDIRDNSAAYNTHDLKSLARRIGVAIQLCDCCRKWCHSRNVKPVYWGSQYVCQYCLENHYVQTTQGESILKGDYQYKDKDHLLTNLQEKLKAHDTDILKGGGPKFCVSEKEVGSQFEKLRFFGAELELEIDFSHPNPPDIIGRAINSFKEAGFAIALRDGSLSIAPGETKKGSGGLELVTLPATKDFHMNYAGWQNLFHNCSHYFRDSKTAGLHFHVSLEGISDFTILKIIGFVNRKHNQQFMYDIAARNFNESTGQGSQQCPSGIYSNGRPEKLGESFEQWSLRRLKELARHRSHRPGCLHNVPRELRGFLHAPGHNTVQYDDNVIPIITTIDPPGYSRLGQCDCPRVFRKIDKEGFNRYQSINVHTQGHTIEFRIFRGSTNEAHFWSCLEFCDAVIEFCSLRKLDEMRFEQFIQWLERRRKLYPHLVQWLINTGWMQDKGKKK